MYIYTHIHTYIFVYTHIYISVYVYVYVWLWGREMWVRRVTKKIWFFWYLAYLKIKDGPDRSIVLKLSVWSWKGEVGLYAGPTIDSSRVWSSACIWMTERMGS